MSKNNNSIYDYYNKSCYKVDKIEPNKTYYKSIHDLLFESLDELEEFYSDIEECNIKDYESFQNYLIETYYEGEEIMNEIKLSIVLPYYETFDLTMMLVKGLVAQLTDETEVILIDDYCKKEFHDMKDELARYHIRLIEHEENQGTAKTRNQGIREAKGKYIAFVDCDDTVTMDYITTLINAIDTYGSEVINFNWLDLSENIVYTRPTNPAMWKAIYRKDVCPLFKEYSQYGEEDVDFQAEVVNLQTTYLDKVLYIYNSNRVGSLYWKQTHRGVE